MYGKNKRKKKKETRSTRDRRSWQDTLKYRMCVCVCEQLNSINQSTAANRILLLYRAIPFQRKETRFLKADFLKQFLFLLRTKNLWVFCYSSIRMFCVIAFGRC